MFRHVEESQTLLINTQSKKLLAHDREVIQFGFGQSPFMPPSHVTRILQDNAGAKEYTSVAGEEALRTAISEFHREHNGLTALPDNILTAPGSKALIFSVLMAFEKADVLLAAPSWVSYAPQALLAGHHVIRMETQYDKRWRIGPETIERAVTKKKHKATLMVLNYPGNPDGLTYTEGELKAIAEMARKLGIFVISDEIYGLLDFSGSHSSLANHYPEATMTTTGLSKWCGAGGWRFGALLLPDGIPTALKKALVGIGSETYSCAPTPVQRAAGEAYQSFKAISPYLKYQTHILGTIAKYCTKELRTGGTKVHCAEGGFYLFVDFSDFAQGFLKNGITSSGQLCQLLLKDTGVALLPAMAFGFQKGYFAARLAFVDFVEPGMQVSFSMEQHAPKIVKGIVLINEWLTKFK